MMNDITSEELRAALAESFPERTRREHERAARIMAAELEAITTIRKGETATRISGRCRETLTALGNSFVHPIHGHVVTVRQHVGPTSEGGVYLTTDILVSAERFREMQALQRADDAQTAGQA